MIDFFLWGYVKHQIWHVLRNQQPRKLRELQAAIVRVCHALPQAMISDAFDAMVSRCRKCVIAGGHAFENE